MNIDITYRLATDADVPALRRLVNAAYAELAEMGLNFTGTYQDEEETRARMQGNEVYLAFFGSELAGTISMEVEEREGEPPVLYLGQLAVEPSLKRKGLGRRLLRLAEEKAKEKGLTRLQLDTAQPATHLVALYRSEGYEVVGDVQWEGKTYRSFIFEKRI